MRIGNGSLENLPLMAKEEVKLCFGERHGLEVEAVMDPNSMVLTNRRLIRLAGVGTNFEIAFIALEDATAAEVRASARGKKPLFRVALLLAGAIASLLTIDFPPLGLPLAAILGLAGCYHLFGYISVSKRGSIHFRTGQDDMEIQFQGDIANQAYAFVNRFFQLKAAHPSPVPKTSQREWRETEAMNQQWWWRTDEVEKNQC